MPGIEKAAGGAGHALATYDPGPITTESLAASVKGEPRPPAATPPVDAGTRELVTTVKGAEAARELGRLQRMIAAQRSEVPSSRDVGLCKTLVSGGAALGATLVTGAVARNPYAAAAFGAAGKALGDGLAWQLCDPEVEK